MQLNVIAISYYHKSSLKDMPDFLVFRFFKKKTAVHILEMLTAFQYLTPKDYGII